MSLKCGSVTSTGSVWSVTWPGGAASWEGLVRDPDGGGLGRCRLTGLGLRPGKGINPSPSFSLTQLTELSSG